MKIEMRIKNEKKTVSQVLNIQRKLIALLRHTLLTRLFEVKRRSCLCYVKCMMSVM